MKLARFREYKLMESKMIIVSQSTFILSQVLLERIMAQPRNGLCLTFCSRIERRVSYQPHKCDEKIYGDWNGIGLTILNQVYVQRRALQQSCSNSVKISGWENRRQLKEGCRRQPSLSIMRSIPQKVMGNQGWNETVNRAKAAFTYHGSCVILSLR